MRNGLCAPDSAMGYALCVMGHARLIPAMGYGVCASRISHIALRITDFRALPPIIIHHSSLNIHHSSVIPHPWGAAPDKNGFNATQMKSFAGVGMPCSLPSSLTRPPSHGYSRRRPAIKSTAMDGITIGGAVRARASRASAFSAGIEMPAARPVATTSLNTAV